jgi:hypothetical protein
VGAYSALNTIPARPQLAGEKGKTMKRKPLFGGLVILALFTALAPGALASNTWYVNGVKGSNKNNCKSPQHACKTIKHAISLALSGDSVMIAAAVPAGHRPQ